MAEAVGFFTDSSVCIGCKACEVACKEWNRLPGDKPAFMDSYDNSGALDDQNWRHVQFIERMSDEPVQTGNGHAWLMLSDVCKHCKQASCMDVCPTGAIVRTEFDTVFIQQDVCNGCRYCISACPFGVIGFSAQTGTVHKCTFCYDRLQAGMTPACAQACLYGRDEAVYGGLNAFFLLMDKPETYGLPNAQNAVLPRRNNKGGYFGMVATALLGAVAAVVAFRDRRMNELGRGKNVATAGGTR